MASGIRREKGTEETPRGAVQDKVEFKCWALSTGTGLAIAWHRAMLQAYTTQPHGQGHVIQYIEILTHCSQRSSEFISKQSLNSTTQKNLVLWEAMPVGG
jgi:hypothetical protein